MAVLCAALTLLSVSWAASLEKANGREESFHALKILHFEKCVSSQTKEGYLFFVSFDYLVFALGKLL